MTPEQADKIIYMMILDGEEFYWKDCPSFSDPAAWTLELYELIEKKPLCSNFIKELEDDVMLDIPFPKESINMAWLFLKSTPEQKAIALATAIEEG